MKNWQVGVGKRVFQKNVVAFRFLKILATLDQPRLIQGIRRRDGIGEDQDTIASIRY